MTDEPITPALTPEEWRLFIGLAIDADVEERAPVDAFADTASPHKCAALCLYGQPFGFTQEDVNAWRALCDEWHIDLSDDEWMSPATRAFTRVIAKIAALLPPPPA